MRFSRLLKKPGVHAVGRHSVRRAVVTELLEYGPIVARE